jgi:exopolysaccharide biosynthesis polyprenyl glycosylphosphotransferase
MVVTKTVLFGSLIVLTIAFLIKSNIPRSLIGFFAVVNLILLSIEKFFLYQFITFIRKSGKNVKRALVLGVGDMARDFLDSVRKYPDWGIKIIGLIGKYKSEVGKERFGYKLVGHTKNVRELLHCNSIDELIIALPAKRLGDMEGIMTICDEEGVPVRIILPFFRNIMSKAKADMIHGLPIIKFSSVERNDFESALKRFIDISISSISLIMLTPVFVVIAALIKLESKGPVFYQWNVLGLNKRPLTSWKFRTMVENADDLKKELIASSEMTGPAFKMKHDPRITGVGRCLRKFSLDELPQFWSVLKGDLSLVGPRPPLQTEVEKYEGWHRRKLSVKPGMTCLWQVNGRNEINDFD